MTQPSNDDFKHPRISVFWDIATATTQPEARIGKEGLWHSPSGSDWVWAEGYIANRSELLERLGQKEISDDRELVYGLYRRLGIEASRSIAGTLSWLLWDCQSQALVAACDRLSNHSFYYLTVGGRFWIVNQLETLLETPGLPRNPNPRAIVAHLTGSAPLGGETFYESIYELEPGGWMRLQGGALESGRYWQLQPQPLLKLASDEEYAQALRELLFRVIAQHAPPGRAAITLSSGLDSTSVAAAVCQAAPQTSLTALCWAAPELPEADESPYSIDVCRHLDIPWTLIRADQIWPMKSDVGIRSSAATPFYGYYTELIDETLRTAHRQGIPVVFSGMSGDHLFGGNVFAYPDLFLTGRWLELARQIRYHLPRSTMKRSFTQIVRRMILSPLREAYLPGWRIDAKPPIPWLRPPYDALYREHFVQPQQVHRMLPGRLARFRLLSHPSLPYFVREMNRRAEYQCVEFRHPLLDHRLIEFAASLPTTQTFRASQRKIIVRNAMRGLLPPSVLEMWDKIVPGAICHRGLREREQAKVWRLMTDMRAAEMGFVDEMKLRQAYQDYLDGKTEDTFFWYTLTLEDWLRRWF